MEDRLLFLADLGEKEEKLFVTKKEGLQELPGYWIYFSKNTQMQEYMLATSPHKSMEGGYQDDVTQNIREVIHRKKELHYNKRNMIYGISSLLFLLMLLRGVTTVSEYKKDPEFPADGSKHYHILLVMW